MVSPPFEVKSQLENVPEGKLKPYFAGLIGWVHRQISTAANTSSRAQRRTYKLHGGPGIVSGAVCGHHHLRQRRPKLWPMREPVLV